IHLVLLIYEVTRPGPLFRYDPIWGCYIVNILLPNINNELDDVIVWRDVRGVFHRFLVAGAWDFLWLRADVVDWYHVVWFPHCIPRHALHMWLMINEKLKTQDRLRQWDVGPSIDLNLLRCPLCEMVPDSHSHLFLNVRSLLRDPRFPMLSLGLFLLLRLIAYGMNGIQDCLTRGSRMKPGTFKFKKMATRSRLLLDQWKIPSSCFDHDGSSRLSWIVFAPIVLLLVCGMLAGFHVLVLVYV
ncbi:reverse transcriptase domain, reverse transcriptase zinc-binding domain protein, partial [Tanacetum coccineum]